MELKGISIKNFFGDIVRYTNSNFKTIAKFINEKFDGEGNGHLKINQLTVSGQTKTNSLTTNNLFIGSEKTSVNDKLAKYELRIKELETTVETLKKAVDNLSSK